MDSFYVSGYFEGSEAVESKINRFSDWYNPVENRFKRISSGVFLKDYPISPCKIWTVFLYLEIQQLHIRVRTVENNLSGTFVQGSADTVAFKKLTKKTAEKISSCTAKLTIASCTPEAIEDIYVFELTYG